MTVVTCFGFCCFFLYIYKYIFRKSPIIIIIKKKLKSKVFFFLAQFNLFEKWNQLLVLLVVLKIIKFLRSCLIGFKNLITQEICNLFIKFFIFDQQGCWNQLFYFFFGLSSLEFLWERESNIFFNPKFISSKDPHHSDFFQDPSNSLKRFSQRINH